MSTRLDAALEMSRVQRADIESRYGIRLLGIVGSVARREERPESDVDIVYDVSGRPTLFDLPDAQFKLEQLLARAVDLVDLKAMRPNARAHVECDLVLA